MWSLKPAIFLFILGVFLILFDFYIPTDRAPRSFLTGIGSIIFGFILLLNYFFSSKKK